MSALAIIPAGYRAIRLARPIARLLLGSARTSSLTSRVLTLGATPGRTRALQYMRSRGYIPSVGHSRLASPGLAQRLISTTIPLYGSPKLNIPSTVVYVPKDLTFRFEDENPANYPDWQPHMSIRPFRGPRTATSPDYLAKLRSHTSKRSGPPEESRRRQDQKVPAGYRRLLSVINRTYGEYDEYVEFNDAFQNNAGDPYAILTALALNEVTDRMYGGRARALRKYVYANPLYRLPVGIDTLTSPGWR